MTVSSRVPDLGPHGEGWVVLQFLLLAAIAAAGFAEVYWPESVESFLVVLGLVIAVAGLLLLALGAVALGRSLTPFPRPREGSHLRRTGIYGRVRHPIYGGLMLATLGWSLAAAPLGLLPTALLVALFDLKSRREEAWLAERYPEYEPYRASTPHRFLPWLV